MPVGSSTKPGFNGESIYDGFVNSDPKLAGVNYTAYNARRTGWFSMLSGAAGYTYGSSGVFDWGKNGITPQTGWGRRSARHLSYLSSLFRGITVPKVKWQLYIPRLAQVATPQPPEEQKRLVIGRATDGSSLIAYLPDNPSIKINLPNHPNLRVNGQWLNPRTGTFSLATAVPDPGNAAFVTYHRPSSPPTCPALPAPPTSRPADRLQRRAGERPLLLRRRKQPLPRRARLGAGHRAVSAE